MLTKAALVYGIAFTLLGILGYALALMVSGGVPMLFGVFTGGFAHSSMYVLSGVMGLAACYSLEGSRVYVQLLGIVYAMLATAGFLHGSVMGIMSVNVADNALHLLLALTMIIFGYGARDDNILSARHLVD